MIFDLAQLLARGHISNPAGGDVGLVRGLVIVREVALSLSLAVRYVFFALFMVRRPRFANALLGGNPYSWKHFGVAGTVFQWGLFMVIAVLLGMQAVWRLSEGSARTGPVYYASAGIEIGLCVVVIFKMAWNVFVSPKSARLPLLRHYVVPIIAFLFGLAISIGNLAYREHRSLEGIRNLLTRPLQSFFLKRYSVAFYKVSSITSLLSFSWRTRT
jgi:hypothetical protein